jgi:hypothetical protein
MTAPRLTRTTIDPAGAADAPAPRAASARVAGAEPARPGTGFPPRGAPVSASGQPARYEVRIEGLLDSHWAAWFEGLHLSNDGTQTVISGPLADQPALHGLLAKIRDLGLCLISVRRLDSSDADDEASP